MVLLFLSPRHRLNLDLKTWEGYLRNVCIEQVRVYRCCLAMVLTPRAAQYCNTPASGVMFLTKVVWGNVQRVNRFADVNSCPYGKHSVSRLHILYNDSLNFSYA